MTSKGKGPTEMCKCGHTRENHCKYLGSACGDLAWVTLDDASACECARFKGVADAD